MISQFQHYLTFENIFIWSNVGIIPFWIMLLLVPNARITKISGGGHAEILCSDKKTRTLVIRGKFRGRNKRSNTIRLNGIVIAGLRSVSMGEVVATNKKEKDKPKT